ncbi:methyltransferase [Gordonia spumicola]|uniref:Methyltransferase n=1 Tax=Gordonia spumicola TaxID=589161 RepID=A0A7I9V4J4_9ACTN|nr:methyltransferase [Gordonia spumicola]
MTEDALDHPEPTYPLHVRLCADCLLLQIPASIRPEETFVDYAYYSSFSDSWVEHARRFVAGALDSGRLPHDGLLVEVASNDGYLLRHAVDAGVTCLGIEPSANVSDAARKAGVPTLTAFLDEPTADAVRAEHGPAALVVANNVYAHIPDLNGFTRSLRTLVADDGWVSIEVHHALNLVELGQFDTVYHEHFQYYTVLSAQRALAEGGLALVDVELLASHGGSIRLWARPAAVAGEPEPSVERALAAEDAAGLHTVDGYAGLAERAVSVKNALLDYLLAQRAAGARVVGYGAPGKGSTLLNYCGIRPDLLEYTVDRNPYKHGRFTPGTRIPIHPPQRLIDDRPDAVVVLPWNLDTEIIAQLSDTLDYPVDIVVPLPTLRITRIGDPADSTTTRRSSSR